MWLDGGQRRPAEGEVRPRIVGDILLGEDGRHNWRHGRRRFGEAAQGGSDKAVPNPSKNSGMAVLSAEHTPVADRQAPMLPSVMPYTGLRGWSNYGSIRRSARPRRSRTWPRLGCFPVGARIPLPPVPFDVVDCLFRGIPRPQPGPKPDQPRGTLRIKTRRDEAVILFLLCFRHGRIIPSGG